MTVPRRVSLERPRSTRCQGEAPCRTAQKGIRISRRKLYRRTERGGGDCSFVDIKSLPEDVCRDLIARLTGILKRQKEPRNLCEDIVQETLLRVFGRSEKFRGEHNLRRLWAWAARIAHNVAEDMRRSNHRHHAQSLDGLPVEPIDKKEETGAAEEDKECLIELLDRLRHEDPENWWLLSEHHVEGRSVKELAKETGRTPNQISSRMSRAIRRMRRWASQQRSNGADRA